MERIPHIISYCWFSNPEKPKSVQKYIYDWHKILTDYESMEWNGSNCDLEHEIDYVKEAYQNKKYTFDIENCHPAITEKRCTVHYMVSSWGGQDKNFDFSNCIFAV
jgi:mannosyltransferase OCH1-like enzyme